MFENGIMYIDVYYMELEKENGGGYSAAFQDENGITRQKWGRNKESALHKVQNLALDNFRKLFPDAAMRGVTTNRIEFNYHDEGASYITWSK